jgi:hypothetical protein
LRLVHVEAIEAKDNLRGVAAYGREHADGDVKALAALQVAVDQWRARLHHGDAPPDGMDRRNLAACRRGRARAG